MTTQARTGPSWGQEPETPPNLDCHIGGRGPRIWAFFVFSSQVPYQGTGFEVEKLGLQLSPSGITGKGLSHCVMRSVPGKQSFCKTIPLYLWICVFPSFLEHNSKNVFNDHTLLSQLLKCLYKKKSVPTSGRVLLSVHPGESPRKLVGKCKWTWCTTLPFYVVLLGILT